MRLSLSTGGDPIRIPRLRRVPRVPRLLLILDVSGSMDRYVRLLLQLAYFVGQHTRRVETFVFSSAVTRVTREMSVPGFPEAMNRVGMAVNHWSGGTRIGESLRRINTAYGLPRRPVHYRIPPQRRLGRPESRANSPANSRECVSASETLSG